jgi:hypothetical protein
MLLGTFTLPNYIDNTAQIRAQIRVQVLPKVPPVYVTLSGDLTIDSKVVPSLGSGKVVNGMIMNQQSN